MTIVESLKKFLTKLGGDPTKLENNATSADIIDAISEAYTDKEGTYTEVTPIVAEGTKIATIKTNNTNHDIYAPEVEDELPAVTSEDQYATLQVNSEGKWAKGIKVDKYAECMSIPVFKGDGSCIPVIPLVYIESETSRTVKDANDYYEVHCSLYAYDDEEGTAISIMPQNLDYFHIDFASAMLIYMRLNDGTNNITLFGTTHWINSRPTSTKYANRIKGAFQDIIAKDIEGTGADLYTPYDVTISFDDSRDQKKWTFKFKLAKITTT